MKKIVTLFSILLISTSGLWAQATPNPGFELWTNHTGFSSYETPNGWDSPNSQTATVATFVCVKATAAADKHSGTYAIKLISKSILGMQDAPGVATTGTLPTGSGGSITGGIAYTLRPDSIVGWYKYTSVSADYGFAGFRLYGPGGDNDSIADATFKTPASTVGTYTRFSKALTYFYPNAVTNSRWLLCSNSNGNAPVLGCILFVDDLDLIFVVRDSIGITTGTNPMCSGQSTTFTSYPHNGGTTPSYQWKVNGANVGTNSSTYTTTTLATGDIVTCVLTSNLTGVTVTGGPATSHAVTVTVGIPTPTISQNAFVLTSSATTGNQWYFNGTLIAGATSQTYTATQTGAYTVVVSAGGCSSTASAPINISTTTGIIQTANDSFFTVYPNPSNGNFNVSFNIALKATYNLELRNTLGQLVYHETLTDFNGSYLKQMNVSQFGKGLYIISLSNPANETIKKVVVY